MKEAALSLLIRNKLLLKVCLTCLDDMMPFINSYETRPQKVVTSMLR